MLSKLKAHRKALGITQNELALRINTTRRSIIRWERGETKPNPEKIQLLAEAIGCYAEDLHDE